MASFKTPQEALLEIKNHVVEVRRDGNRTLRVKCDSSSYANGMINTYAVLYGTANVGDAGFHFLNTDKYAYPRFSTSDLRENALDITEALINGEQVTYVTPGTITIGPAGITETPGPTVTIVEEEEEPKKQTDWTTYIVIGAAAAVILLLLWDSKKK